MEKNTQGSITLIVVFLVFVAAVMAGLYFYTKWNKPQETEEEKKKKEAEAQKLKEAEAQAQKLKELEQKNESLKNEISQEVKNMYPYLPPPPNKQIIPKTEEEYIGNVDDNLPNNNIAWNFAT